MKKCDYPHCKKNAEVFGKEKSYCMEHAEQQNLVRQTNLVSDFGFPDMPKNLKLGDKKDG
jgi:hypothetical protein